MFSNLKSADTNSAPFKEYYLVNGCNSKDDFKRIGVEVDDGVLGVGRQIQTLLVLEKEELMKDVLHAHMGDGLEVTIGQENEDSHFKDSSIITATYHLDGELLGTIAVLGPTRMEYAKAMSLLEYMNSNLTEVIKRFHW